ncbi:MAG: TIGR00374 family protein [Flavobacteriales bacterium]|nr:MAG: TIGR00374 family protein [Flavobacteriales bacterium]
MSRKTNPIRTLLSPSKILIPILIGLIVVAVLLVNNFDKDAFEQINWSYYTAFWLFLSLLFMAVRDIAYMYRIRVLTNNELSWRRAFDVIFLWEFASSVTPSIVGGAPIAIFIINKEGINLGRSTTIVLITSLLDEIFFITMVPLLYFFVFDKNLFPVDEPLSLMQFEAGSKVVFIMSYILIVFYCCFISFGLFINPKGFKYLLIQLFRLPLLRKWKAEAEKTGDEIIIASGEVKKWPAIQWFKAFIATYFSWTARYFVVNCLIMAFLFTNEHFLIYARQLIMWVIMLISPTPGSSGVAEYAFSAYLFEFIPNGLEATLALLWRLVSYYPYLFIGAILLPGWVKRVYIKRKLIKFKS